MKKYKILSAVLGLSLLLTGCATVGDVKGTNGKNIYFDEIAYNQGQVVQVGDYVYYGNAYFSSSDSSFSYSKSQKKGYLSRINTSKDFTYDSSVEVEDRQNTTPKEAQKVNGDKLVGYQNQNMFALGSYLYFTSANTHKNSSLENDYTQVSLFRIKFNGDKFEEIATYKHDENSIITATKGSDNNYYYVISEPTSDSYYNLYSIKIGDNLGKAKQLNKYKADGEETTDKVLTCTISDKDSTVKKIVYTVASTKTMLDTTTVKAVDFATGSIETLDEGVVGSETKLLGRVGDQVFYSYKYSGKTEIYFKDLANSDGSFSPNSNRFYDATSISNIMKVNSGYVFVSTSSKSVMFENPENTSSPVLLLTSDDYTDILFTDGNYVYYSDGTSISRINVVDKTKQTIVSMTAIISGQVGYTGDYIYFFAQIEGQEDDTNYYMYRTDKEGNYQLIAKTK